MDETQSAPPIVNAYEVEVDGIKRHLICFLDPGDAQEKGIDIDAIVGEFNPDSEGEFDSSTFALNPDFVKSLTDYMNDQSTTPALILEARKNAGGWLYLLDPRFVSGPGEEPPETEVIGAYAVDESGVIVDDSFRYNEKHTWFDKTHGVSGVLADRRFYEWLHED